MKSLLHQFLFSWRYLGTPPWDTHISPPELMEYIQNHPAGNALDLGCGTGTNCLTLARNGWTVTGVDLAGLAIYKARRKFAAENLRGRFIVSNVIRVSLLTEHFDLILDIGCYHNLPPDERSAYHENIHKWLKEDGSLLLYGHVSNRKGSENVFLTEENINQLSHRLFLEDRKDCTDAWQRQTVWLCFRKPG